MQLLRYMVYIWEDYEKEMEKQKKGISKTKGFRYPPILPIVYYEGTGKWTASCNIQDRILFHKAFEPFTQKFFFKLIQLNSYNVNQLIDKNDELSLLMLINRLQSSTAFRNMDLPEDYIKNLSENSTDELLDIIARITAAMLRHLNLPEDEVEEFTGQVKDRKMAELFENFKDIDLPAARKKAKAQGWAKGHAKGLAKGISEGHAEGKAKGLAEGEALLAKLTQTFISNNRMDDLTKALADLEYREKLYKQNNL